MGAAGKFFAFFALSLPAFSATCTKAKILGPFPKISGMGCNNYALMIAFTAIIGAYLFWSNITK
jgi:hypothetical protein